MNLINADFYSLVILVICVLCTHWVADFVLQSDSMARNKSKHVGWLLAHVVSYGVTFWIVWGWQYAAVNASLHFVIDFITSRITAKLWEKGETHYFFVVIGLDQLLHSVVLILTLPMVVL